jgi:hypothetical protein
MRGVGKREREKKKGEEESDAPDFTFWIFWSVSLDGLSIDSSVSEINEFEL